MRIVFGSAVAAAALAAGAAFGQGVDGPVVSPDGLHEVWAPAGCHCLWGAERASPDAAWPAPRKLFEIKGAVGKIAFSPDGSRIAFENPRGDWTVEAPRANPAFVGLSPPRYYGWGFIAVYDFAHDRLSYVDPSFATDTDPRWKNDRDIAFTRHAQGAADAQLTRSAAVAPEPAVTRGSAASYLDAPLSYQPIVSADGTTGAFVSREGESRAVYLFGVEARARRYIAYGGDDGQALSNIALTPNGDLIAYVRGARPNKLGDVPNPRALPKKPMRELWVGGTAAGQAPKLIGEGEDPMFTPDGRRLVFTGEKGLMIAPLFRGGAGGVRVGDASVFVPGRVSDATFSPDGSKLLYARGDRLFVYDLASDRTTPIDHPKGTDDLAPIWSPDGSKIAFIRSNVPREAGYNLGYDGPFVAEKPWSLALYDVGADRVHQIWQAKPGVGSAFYPLDEDATETGNPGEQLYWTADDRIVFPWESDGWRHLYAVPVAGGEAQLLTRGDGEIESVTQTPDRKSLIAATNIGDLGRRHIAHVDVASATIIPITPGKADQWGPAPMANGTLAYVEAGWAEPPQIRVRATSAAAASALPALPATYPTAWLEPKLIELKASDGATAYGQLFVPAHPNGCGVVFAHGGIKRQMLPGFHYMDAYSVLYETNQYLASKGCVVLSVEYRSSIMRGYAFRNAPGWGSAGATEMMDVAAAGTYLKTHRELKVRHVGVYGLSWGGYITAQALTRYPDIFEAGFDMAGVHEFFGDRVQFSSEARIGDLRAPIYLVQGDDDRNVDFYQGMSLAALLRAHGADATFKVVPDEVHDMTSTFSNMVEVYGGGADFLYDRLTRPAKPRAK
ncbi:MAG TPA: prolyl oligopeptidase family serine peptidase [Caulobacteraceae bacterium]|jgi:dipeptidyl aminopeptidase/acylaminoacyl peptidase|nr:prolyl oligopeptidase family serine peptidase [Caulobacteraceae bacterium]